jgi:hypothetical protein
LQTGSLGAGASGNLTCADLTIIQQFLRFAIVRQAWLPFNHVFTIFADGRRAIL